MLTICVQVMVVIDAAVNHLDDLDSLEGFLLNLGSKHQAVGVKTQSFAVSIGSKQDSVCFWMLCRNIVELIWFKYNPVKINSSSKSKVKFSQISFLCWSGGWRGPALHAAVQSWNGLHSCTAPGLAQHVHYRSGCHDQRLGKEWRTQIQLSSGRT